ncbi:MAG: hypothetical protein KKI02_10330, partial [Planctomycetes bacterium]|nr:hypothetical protein [Planctomycetota bacterium]
MTNLSSLEPRDVYLATNSDAYGWGGGLSSLSALGAELHRLGHSTLILGTRNVSNVASQLNPATPRLNLDSGVPRLVWRARNWCVPRALSRSLRRLPPPRLAFVGVSPFWVIAAKRIWPTVPVVFLFAALLSNCLPFTWRRRLGFWQRIDFAGIRRAEHLALSLADQTFTPTRQAHEEVLAFHPAARGRVAVCTYSCEPQDLDEETRAARRRALR